MQSIRTDFYIKNSAKLGTGRITFLDSNSTFPSFERLTIPEQVQIRFSDIVPNNTTGKRPGFSYRTLNSNENAKLRFSTLTRSSFAQNPWLRFLIEHGHIQEAVIQFNASSSAGPEIESSIDEVISYNGKEKNTPYSSSVNSLRLEFTPNANATASRSTLYVSKEGSATIDSFWIAGTQEADKVEFEKPTAGSGFDKLATFPPGQGKVTVGFNFAVQNAPVYKIKPSRGDISWILEGTAEDGIISDGAEGVLDFSSMMP